MNGSIGSGIEGGDEEEEIVSAGGLSHEQGSSENENKRAEEVGHRGRLPNNKWRDKK